MDDDIDIEEHDVMDNPRIKSIFPDLSCVKIELPDEEDVPEEQYGILQPTEEPQEMLYQYEYSFETTADNVSENEALSQENEDCEEGGNTNYFYNNEIILGSKPPLDLDLLYEEALNSHPIVYLENWEERLYSSPCFCDTCEILFPTVNALDAHKMISHSYLVAMESPQKNTARKSTVTSKYCNHCSKTFPDDTSLIKHLYELLPLNNFPQVKDEKKEPESSKGKIYSQMSWPKKIKSTPHVITKLHLKKEPEDIKVKVEDLKVKLKTTLSRDGKFFATSSLVPKSTLFQCNVCQICFISCFSAAQHTKYCRKILSFVKCGICKRKVKTKDVTIHGLQHSYNDKLKIYTMNKSIYERVLCKCPKCASCFDELAFWAHYQNCKKSVRNSVYCADCDVNIALSRIKGHRLKHSLKKLTKKDFIIIEFYDQNAMGIGKETQVEILRVQRKKDRETLYRERRRQKLLLNASKENDEITLYYCEYCGCCQYILNFKGHTDGSCKFHTAAKRYCEKCGLCFTIKSIASHLVLHEKRSFSLKDINIVSLRTGKLIDPPMSEFFKCGKCSIHFLCRRTLNLHNCETENYINCKICTKKFNIQAYQIHKIFHSVDKLMPELMKKYNLINSTWNIMYMCLSCELVTMTYDAAVTHSQGHLNYIISDLHKQCVVCDLRIAEREFHLHEKLHTNNDAIERESFKILKYDYENLFKREWLQVFKELPKVNRQEILSKSIYRFTRSVKMQIEISASSTDTKYFCVNCNHFVEGPNIRQHILSKCLKNNKLVCNICREIFKTLKQFLSHEGSHEKLRKRQTIVSFNNECDKEFNNHLCLIEAKSKKSSKEVPLSKLRDILMSESTKAAYKLYKCAKCETCVTLKSSSRRHRCVTDNDRCFCTICQQYYCVKQKATHVEAHKKKPFINKYSFHIIYFNDDSKTAKTLPKKAVTTKITLKRDSAGKFLPRKDVFAKMTPNKYATPKLSPKKDVTAKIFQCTCGLHFTSLKTVEKHLDVCTPKLEVSKEICSKCNLVFPTEVLVTHLINHHHKETKIVIEKIGKNNLLKCSQCAIFFTNMNNFNSHKVNCDPKNGTQCKNCRLTFGKICFKYHLCSSEDTTYLNKITVVRKKLVKEGTVYKCTPCNICYLRRNSLKYHTTDVNHSLKKDPTTCEICGLRFTNCSFRKHTNIHSFPNEDFRIKVIDPETGNFEFITGSNRVTKKDDGNTESKISPRKRQGDIFDENSDLVKKAKTSTGELDVALSERRSTRATINKPSTSRDSRMFDDTPTEIIVPDEISIHTTENISDIDHDASEMTSPDKTNETLEKSGISSKLKSRIIVKGYSNKLYKCIYCNQHYLKEGSFDYHAKNHKLQDISENYKCDICELEFSRYTLPRHKYVHHDNMGLKKDDFLILTETVYSKESEILERIKGLNPTEDVLQRIEMLISKNESKIVNFEDAVSDPDNFNDIKVADVNVSDICDITPITDNNPLGNTSALSDTNPLNDTNLLSDTNQLSVTSDNAFCVVNNDISDTNQLSDTCKNAFSDVNNDISDTNPLSDVKISEISETTDNISVTDKIYYYKCLDCNVCFVDQKMCFEHTLKHDILDPKTYIQCKLCDFQFLIDSLKEHMVLHHTTDFKIESLTIHEYKSLGIGLDPKIDIYQAVDKLQSRLVSTTTDVGVL